MSGNKSKKSFSRPYNRENSILGRLNSVMKQAIKNYTPSLVQTNWVQTLLNDDEDEIREEEDSFNRVASYRNSMERCESGKGIYERNNESFRSEEVINVGIDYEGSQILENDNSVTVEFKGYEATFPKRNTLNNDEINSEDTNTVGLRRPSLRGFALSRESQNDDTRNTPNKDEINNEMMGYNGNKKLKRGRTDNYKEESVVLVPPFKKYATSAECQTDDTSFRTDSSIGIDRAINSFKSYPSYNNTPCIVKTPSHSHNITNSASTPLSHSQKSYLYTLKSSNDHTDRNTIHPNSVYITKNQSQQPTSRLFVSNRGRSFISKAEVSTICPTTPLYSKKNKSSPEPPMNSPFYNRPITYGGIMAYQGYKPLKPHKSDSNNSGTSGQPTTRATNLNNTMNRINKAINRFDNQEATKEAVYKFPPLKYNTELYKRMTAGGASLKEGPPIKNRQTLPQYSLNQQPSKNSGKMMREKDKMHEVRGKKNEEEEEEDEDAKDSMLFLSNIRLPPMQLQPLTSSSFTCLPPSTSHPSSSPPLITNQSTTNTKPPPTKSVTSPYNNSKITNKRFNFKKPISVPENATRANAFQWMPTKTVETSKQATSQKTLLGSFTVNYDTAKRKESLVSKSTETIHVKKLKQGSVLDALNKLPTTTSTTQTPPSTSSISVKSSKWVCNTCMVENLGDTKSCIYCFNAKPTPASKSLFSTTTKTSPVFIKETKPSMPIPPMPVTTTNIPVVSNAGGAIASIPSPAKAQTEIDADKGTLCEPASTVSTSPSTTQSKSTLPSLASMFAAKQGEWSCDVCMLRNSSDVLKCVACESDKPGSTKSVSLGAAVVASSSASSTTMFSTPATSTPKFGTSNPTSTPFGATPTTASQVQLNLTGGGFKFGPDTTPTTLTGGFKPTTTSLFSANLPTSQPSISTTNNFGGFKPISTLASSLLSANLPTSQPPISTSNNFGGFRFASEQSLPTSTATVSATVTNTFGVLTATTTSSTSQTTTTNPSTSSTFSFGITPSSSNMFPATTTSANTGFGAASTAGGSITNTGFFAAFNTPTSTTASFQSAPSQSMFGAGLTNASQSAFSLTTTSNTSFFPTATTTISMFGNNPTSTTTTKAIVGMFGGSTVSTANSLFGNNATTANPIFNNKSQASSLFPPSNNQFSLFPSATTTTSTNTFVTTTTTQSSFLTSNTTSTPSNAFQLPNNNTFSGFSKQENNNNFLFKNNNNNNSIFSTSSTQNLFQFSTSQTTLSTSTGNSSFQFGAQPSTNTAFSSPQAFSFSMGKKTENPKKRAFNSSADNEVDSKKANSVLLPSAGFSFGNSNNNQGSNFSSTSSSMLQPSTAFTFGQQHQPSQQQPSQQQPTQPAAFSFGQQPPQQQTPFQFGNQQQQTVFSFGQQQPQQQTNPQQSTFTFGQQPQQQTSAFGQQTPQQNQSSGFNFSSTPNFNFTGSGNASNATFTAQNTTPIPGRSYKKAVRRMRK